MGKRGFMLFLLFLVTSSFCLGQSNYSKLPFVEELSSKKVKVIVSQKAILNSVNTNDYCILPGKIICLGSVSPKQDMESWKRYSPISFNDILPHLF